MPVTGFPPVESAAILGIFTANIQRDRILTALSGPPKTESLPPIGQGPENSPAPGTSAPAPPPEQKGGAGRVSLPGYLLGGN